MSAKVQVLPPQVAERIAAGEVIERPASVVKELIENSIDAGATEISVNLEDGGKSLIEITDNGHGIAPEDLVICIRRHATSKLSSLDDLERIVTLGFRGEALPSIGAVADVELLSRAKNEESAAALSIRSMIAEPAARSITFGHFLGSPHGTRVQARGLFAQVPARLKFLKAQSAEVAQIREWIERLALARPETGFRLISDGRAILTLRPQEESARVRTILSDASGDYPMVTSITKEPKNGIKIRAHWLQGMSSHSTKRLVQVVNGRAIRDRMLQQAILTSFKQALLPGQFPSVAVYIDVPTAEIDVNVHPTKTEVRFLNSRQVFHAVESLLSEMIRNNGAPGFVPGSEKHESPTPWQPAAGSSSGYTGWQARDSFFAPSAQAPLQLTPSWAAQSALQTQQAEQTLDYADTHGLTRDRYVGAFFNTYLMYDLGEELALIDQHAAHERIRYELLRHRALNAARGASGSAGSSQALLIPEAIRFLAEDRATLEPRLEFLAALGFETEIFGEDTLLFRTIPAEWGSAELRIRLKNLIDRLIAIEVDEPSPDWRKLLVDEKLFEKLASEACHSAVRAGDRLETLEALEIVEQLFRCEHPWNCPHGRPTVVRIPKSRVEEWFQRKV
ncbi:MAG: DNA mismatch repair endonuclease MutL [Oligoflexia bacterium]|nr:DNA mismatch repair endonuclease MutL [Oligoflexia bacterium]